MKRRHFLTLLNGIFSLMAINPRLTQALSFDTEKLGYSNYGLQPNSFKKTVIKVIGIGGCGGNAIEHMAIKGIENVSLIGADTGLQFMENIADLEFLPLGVNFSKDPEPRTNLANNLQTAIKDCEGIREMANGADLIFITAGMGGEIGTRCSPIMARILREMGIYTVAVVTTPFSFEGKKRKQIADKGISTLKEHVDLLITIPNEPLWGKNTRLLDFFLDRNDMFLRAVQSVSNLITQHDVINVEFSEMPAVMSKMGTATIGYGCAQGKDRACVAAATAIASLLSNNIDTNSTHNILINISAGQDMTIGEFETVINTVMNFVSDDTTPMIGVVNNSTLKDELQVTLVAGAMA